MGVCLDAGPRGEPRGLDRALATPEATAAAQGKPLIADEGFSLGGRVTHPSC